MQTGDGDIELIDKAGVVFLAALFFAAAMIIYLELFLIELYQAIPK